MKRPSSAVEVVDECLGKLMEVCAKEGIAMLLTADHGNADEMTYNDQSPNTSHSKSLVPFALISPKIKGQKIEVARGRERFKRHRANNIKPLRNGRPKGI